MDEHHKQNKLYLKKENIEMKKQSGVDKSLYRVYDFKDHLWSWTTSAGTKSIINDLLALSEFLVLVNGEYWMYNPMLKSWNQQKNESKAKAEARNTLLTLRLSNGTLVDEILLETYFSGYQHTVNPSKNNVLVKMPTYIGSCPQLDGVMSIPMGPKFLEFDNRRFLNIWRDNGMTGAEENLDAGLIIARLIYRSLCNGAELDPNPAREAQMLHEQIRTGRYTDANFEFTMHYLASIYQFQGINLLTNLWFVGTLEGTGKGTLIYIMTLILGYAAVGQLSAEEISKRGWSDHLMAKQLIEVNEFSQDDHFDWLSWIKRNCNEPFVLISKRGETPISVINTANYIFALNPSKGRDILRGITVNDRRNHMIETTTEKQWVGFASLVREDTIRRPAVYAQGFTWILEQVQVDAAKVRYSFLNDFKRKLISEQEDPITSWLSNDTSLNIGNNTAGLSGTEYTSQDLYLNYYKKWAKEYNRNGDAMSLSAWGRLMKAHPCVITTTARNVVHYEIVAAAHEARIDWQQARDEFQTMTKGECPDARPEEELGAETLPVPTKRQIMAELLRKSEQKG